MSQTSEPAEIDEPVHCRLFFIMARNANTGVIFRRGPSKWVQIIRWNTGKDIFEPGQWFHGRIYEQRCDLSPNGKLMIYFARQSSGKTRDNNGYTYAWTAISRPPYLTALALWPKGNCWHGGGQFETNKRVWLNHHPNQAVPHPNHVPQGIEVIDNPNAHGEDAPVLRPRLERDGWVFEQDYTFKSYSPSEQDYFFKVHSTSEQPLIYRKPNLYTPLTLVMASNYTSHKQRFEFTIRHESGETSLNGAEWADWDRRGRLVFARAGKLFVGQLNENGELHEQELADFDAARFSPVVAPDWAKQW